MNEGARGELGDTLLSEATGRSDEFVAFLTELASIESPTPLLEAQTELHGVLGPAFEDLGFEVRIIEGRKSGNHFLARPKGRIRGEPIQLLVGHTDTVWDIGTLERMPLRTEDGRLHGPGTLDMKGGLTQIVTALRILRSIDATPTVWPVVFINSDEEVGSPDSKKWVARLARAADRALVAEPAMGDTGLIKTARKGVARFDLSIRGKAAHAGLEPHLGASAISELSTLIRRLHALNDSDAGTTVNVGVVSGGVRPNVVAPHATASVDSRFVTSHAGEELVAAVRALEAEIPGVSIHVSGGMEVAPLERTPRNVRLWEAALRAGRELGLELEDTLAGGGSDGNTTSLHTATLDGLGCVGDGAHADHEHILIEPTLKRCALLARLLLEPSLADA